MKIRRILQPGQPGTKKLVDTYGDNLICVRYRYDHDKKKMLKTIEIIVDSKPWGCDPKDIPRNGIMNIRIAIDEMELRRRVKAAGGKWDPNGKCGSSFMKRYQSLGCPIALWTPTNFENVSTYRNPKVSICRNIREKPVKMFLYIDICFYI